MSRSITDVTDTTFDEAVLTASHDRPVVVDFWAAWCGPCRQLSPLLERVAARFADDVTVVKVDVDAAQDVARTYRIQGIPTVMAFRDGQAVSSFTGLQPETSVERFFAALVPTPADRLADEAAQADPARAEEAYREALSLQPDHGRATVGLARLLADRGAAADAIALLQRIPQAPAAQRLLAELRLAGGGDVSRIDELRAQVASDPAARIPLGRALAANGSHEEALVVLLDAVAEPATRENARQAVLEVFAVLGEDHPAVRLARPRLATALFA